MKTNLRSQNGSVLISAMVFGVLLAALLASYLAVSLNSMRASHRAFHYSLAMNLAETGLEEAFWALNNGGVSTTTGWTKLGTGEFTRSVTVASQPNANIMVLVKDPTAATGSTTVVARAKVPIPLSGGEVEKMVEVKLKRAINPEDGPSTGREGITIAGKPEFTSYRSDHDKNPATAPRRYNELLPDGTYNISDSAAIATPSVTQTVDVGGGKVWGKVHVGGEGLDRIVVGNTGVIGPFKTPEGQKPGATTDFSANLPDVTVPNTLVTHTGIPADHKLVGNNDPFHPVVYSATSLELVNAQLEVSGYVELRLNALPGTSAVKISGNDGGINIDGTVGTILDRNGTPVTGQSSGLYIYTQGDVSITGRGAINGHLDSKANFVEGVPACLKLYGTLPRFNSEGVENTPQQIEIHGNGSLSAIVNAPNADISVTGGGSKNVGGEVYGTLIGRTLSFKGGGQVAIRRDLSSYGDGSSQPLRLSAWRELVGAQRSPYESKLN